MLKSEALREQANAALEKARQVAKAADEAGRQDMTAEEKADYARHTEAAATLVAQMKTAREDESVVRKAQELGLELGVGPAAVGDLDAQVQAGVRQPVKSLGRMVTESAQFTGMMKSFGGRIPEGARVHSDPIEVKALLTGASDTSAGVFVTPEQTDIVETLGRRPLTIRDLISVRRTTSDAVEFVRQTSHTNAAAPVPEATSAAVPEANAVAGGYKPQGSWAFERATATVKTIAEWVPATKRALSDVAALQGLIDDELRADLAETEEDQVLTGSGTGENLTGILSTSGIQTQAYDTDKFTTLRKSKTKVTINGRTNTSAFVLNPYDAQMLELQREDGATGAFLGGGPFGQIQRTVWGVPYVESEKMPEGKFLAGDFSKAVLWDREQASVTISDSHADFFIRNLVAVLAEERVAFAVTRPSAFVLGSFTTA